MNGQPKFQVKKLKEYAIAHNPSGTCSVVRAIDLVLKSSLDSPLYASKEILLVWGSLVSVDPIETPINPYLTDKIQNQSITIISISPEVHALKKLSEVGPGNKFIVATSQTDFTSRLSEYINPRINTQVKPVYVKMGFPMKTSDTFRLVKCVCHKEMQSSVYVCPQCQGFVCEIPTNCPVCKLTLVDKDMLTRVHRLLYSMPTYTVIPAQVQTADMHPTEMAHICFGCDSYFTEGGAVCDACGEKFCYECDMFAHDSLKHCPGCLTAPTGDR
jgi:transcription initiation factor TFIIH subunit 2